MDSRPAPDARGPHDPDDAGEPVRPYALVGGRTRVPDELGLSVESLVHGVAGPMAGLSPEARRVLDVTLGQYQSLAEVSANLRLPLGVVRVLVADLAGSGRMVVHGREATAVARDPGAGATDPYPADRSLLESVLDGIATL